MCVCEYSETPQLDTCPCVSIKAAVSVVVVLANLLFFLWFLIPSPLLFCKLCSFVLTRKSQQERCTCDNLFISMS